MERLKLQGKTFGYLTVLELSHISRHSKSVWKCKCVCGKEVVVVGGSLLQGLTKSCGCLSGEYQKQTWLKKYGVENISQSKEIQEKKEQTWFKKYGVPHPLQNKEIALKAAKSANNSHTLRHWKTGEELVCLGGYEKKVVQHLNENKVDYDWQPKTFHMPDGRTYRPDLYLLDDDLWVEIKGWFRKDAQEKWNWFSPAHPNSKLWDKKYLLSAGIL
jgi:hypothetical protein